MISIGGGVTSDPAVVSWGPNRLDVFIRRTDNAVWHKWWDGRNWYPSQDQWADSRGGILTSDPAVVSWGPNRLDVFARGADNGLYHISYENNVWSNEGDLTDWEYLGRPYNLELASSPLVVSRQPNRLDVFARGADNGLYHIWWDGSRWSNELNINNWERRGGILTSDPAVVSWGPNRLDVFARGADNGLYHISYENNVWSNEGDLNHWKPRGGILTSDPAVVSWGPNRLDVFARGTDNGLYHIWWDGSRWSNELDINNWEYLGRLRSPLELTSDPAVSSLGPDNIWVFVKSSDNRLFHKYWRHGWSPSRDGFQSYYSARSAILSSAPIVVPRTHHVFFRGIDNALWVEFNAGVD